jgi:hypothetical protein
MANTRRVYAGAASETTLTEGVNSTATSIVIDDATGWPSSGSFYAVIDPGTASEEKFLANGRTGTTITLATASDRGVDGTTAQAHNAGAVVWHTIAAVDLDEANNAVVNTIGRVTAKGDLLVGTSLGTIAKLAVGSNNQMVFADSSTTTGLRYGALPDGAVSSSLKMGTGVVAATNLAADSVTAPKVADDAILNANIVDGAVDADKLAASVAGSGLAGGAGTALSVVVDDSTIEIATDTVQVKALGITDAELAADSVTTAKIEDDAVTLAKIDDDDQHSIAELPWTIGNTAIIGTSRTTEPIKFLSLSATATPTAGAFTINFGQTFTGIQSIIATPGDNSSSLSQVQMILASCTTSAFAGGAFTPAGTAINGTLIRVNLIVVGW